MRAPTKKLLDLASELDMLPNSLWISTLPIQQVWSSVKLFDLGDFTSIRSLIEVFSHYYDKSNTSIYYSTPYSRILHFLTTAFEPYLNLAISSNAILLLRAPGFHQGGGDLLSPIPVPPSTSHSIQIPL